MIKFEDFFTVANPDRTKVKFNMNAGDPTKRAWDFLKKGEDNPDWIGINAHKTKHASVKGVYCITDKSTGQLYIGSASGDNEGIWQRWSAYASVSNLTGGNKTFEELKKNGADYIIDNFTYSIIEIFDMRTDPKYIIQREEHWKNVFKTVQFGMNNVRTK